MKLSKKTALVTSLVCAMLISSAHGALISASAASRGDDAENVQVAVKSQRARTVFSNEQDASEHEPTSQALVQGAQDMRVNINGRRVLQGRVFAINGTTYVPMFKFCDWLGVFSYSYDRSSGTARVSGKNLEITAKEGTLYISANGRYFYSVEKVIEVNGEIYVPIRPLTKALNSKIEWSNADGEFKVYSGDTSLLRSSSQVYRDDEIYWLARIINAEAGGEPMQGKIAVGNVILNRVRSSAFPSTIYSVIFDKKYGTQFSPTANGAIYKTPNADSIIAAKMCIEGYSLSTEVLYFFNPKVSPTNWISQNRKYAFTVGNHVFYY